MEQKADKSRSGSESRRRQHRITFRLSPHEHNEIEAKAERLGISLGSFIRATVLDAPTTRATRRPTIEVQAVTRLQGEMNKVGSNIHQILRRVNFGESPTEREFHEALTGYREVVFAILTVLGRRKERP